MPDDQHFLRKAIALSAEAAARGARPFGAVVVDEDGRVVAEALSVPPVDPRDWTAHSEMQALRTASAALTWAALGRATIYASAEPCPMCAAAIYWCNIRRLVYSVSEPAMRALARALRARRRHHHAMRRDFRALRPADRGHRAVARGGGAPGSPALLVERKRRRVKRGRTAQPPVTLPVPRHRQCRRAPTHRAEIRQRSTHLPRRAAQRQAPDRAARRDP